MSKFSKLKSVMTLYNVVNKRVKLMEWLRETVFPDAVRTGGFGPNVKRFVSFESRKEWLPDHYFSDIISGDVTLEDNDGQLIHEIVIVKVQPDRDLLHEAGKATMHWSNEILFYTDFVPLLRKYDTSGFLKNCIPEFIYGKTTYGQSPKEDVIILRRLCKKGFRFADESVFLDEDHLKLVLDRIAKFHALSYKCLREEPETFQSLVSKIKVVYLESAKPDPTAKHSANILQFRGIEPLKSDAEYSGRLEQICGHCEDATTWLNKYMDPSELLNVLTHGDLTYRNFLFRYGVDGKPEEVAVKDWGLIKYCSPVVDISLLIMLHSTGEMKRLHWDELMKTYYDALCRELNELAPSFADLELEMRKKGVYGYHWTVFKLPEGLESGMKEKMEALERDEIIPFLLEFGGPKATQGLVDIVKHMLDRNFIFDC